MNSDKKRYAMLETFDLKKNLHIPGGEIVVKGLDIVRSTFPTLFKDYMKQFIEDLLRGKTKDQVNQKMMDFVKGISTTDYSTVARNTAVKKLSKYTNTRHHIATD